MTFYQELQLSSAGSKQLIKNTKDKDEKRRHILIYNLKVYIVMIFCVAVVTIFSKLTGNNNSVVGVTVLLAVLVLNIVCIMLLMIMSCHNVIMYNHSTFVLGYLLLQGYDVTGDEYLLRVAGLVAGMVICMAIFYKNQKNRPYRRTFKDLFLEFNIDSARNRWYIKLTLIVSSAMLITSLAGFPRSMWIGIACMSVCLPFSKDIENRMGKRAVFNVVGCVIFMVLYLVLPESMYPYIGMIGGIGVGYSAGYAWQTAFNTFGALSIAAGLFGMPYAVMLRIGMNVAGAFYTWVCDKILDRVIDRIEKIGHENNAVYNA